VRARLLYALLLTMRVFPAQDYHSSSGLHRPDRLLLLYNASPSRPSSLCRQVRPYGCVPHLFAPAYSHAFHAKVKAKVLFTEDKKGKKK
jgi:hypothetical protein